MQGDIMDFLMSQKNGANYVVLYQMLCIKTINTEGKLATQIGEVLIPFDVEKIQRECKWFDVDTIRVALELYKKLGLIYEQADGIIKISQFKEMVGSESYWNKQKKLAKGENKDVGNELEKIQQPLISNSNILMSNIYNSISNSNSLSSNKESNNYFGNSIDYNPDEIF